MELQSGQPIDRYVIVRPLARGGMAAVYEVRHTQLGSRHALKVLLSAHPGVQQRLLQEGRAQSQLRHRHIVAVSDIVSIGGAPGLVMDFIDGPTLRAFLEERRLDWSEIDVLARGMLSGVAAAHAVGVVHRDLKPANVLLAWEDQGWIPKIADFGVAKVVGAAQTMATRTGAGLGTPAYMAPEQTFDASKVDHRADVFALGAILFELVTGTRAFPGSDLVEIYTLIRSGRRPAVTDLAPGAPDRMVAAIDGALHPDPDQRTPTVAAMLDQWVDGTSLPQVVWPVHEGAHQALQGGVDVTTGTPTFTWAVDETPQTFESQSLVVDPPSEALAPALDAPRRWPAAVAGLLGLLALAAVGTWASLSGPSPTLGVGDVPELLEAPAQASFARGWQSLLQADDLTAERHLMQAVEESPEAHVAWATLAWSRGRQGKEGGQFAALWKAVELAEGDDGLHAEALIALGKRRRLGWQEGTDELLVLAEAHPDDLLLTWLAIQALPRDQDHAVIHLFERARERHGLVPVTHEQLARWVAREDPARSESLAAASLEQFPRNPSLLIAVGEAQVAQGELEDARVTLTEALRFAPGRFGTRHRLAELTLMSGDEATTLALVEASMAASEPMPQRTAFAYRMALAYAGLGRPNEGEALLERGAAAAGEEQDYMSKAWLLGMVALIEMDAGCFDRALDAAKRMNKFAATSPEIPEGERSALSRHMLEGRAMLAGRSGDIETAERLVARLENIEGVRAESIEWTRREIAVAKGDLEALPGLFEHSSETCAYEVERARCYDDAGDPHTARQLLTALFADNEVCGRLGEDRWASAMARVRAASLAVAAGQPEEARAHLEVYRSLWPNPDSDLPVVMEAAGLLEHLSTL